MLLNFEVENYKSFLNNAAFSMIPAPKQHGLDYSILTVALMHLVKQILSAPWIH